MRTLNLKVTLAFAMLAVAAPAMAQPQTQNVEVEPVTCWWRSGSSSVRVGQPFTLVLTCSALETEAARAVIDRGRLASAAVQLPPFEVTGGAQTDDVVTASRRFLQYEYTLRLIGEDVFGAEVPIPSLQISYRIESKVQQDSAVQGREQTYVLPAIPLRIASLVPSSETHIREGPVATLSEIAARDTRGTLLRTIGTIAFALAALLAVVAVVRAFQQRRSAVAKVRTHLLSDAAILSSVRRELRGVQQQAAREGWNEALSARALAAMRVTASYAAGQPVAQRTVAAGNGYDGQLIVRRVLGRPVLVSGSATTESLAASNGATATELRDILSQLTSARYGRAGANGGADFDAAMQSGIDVTNRVAAQHTWIATALGTLRRSIGGWRERVWAR